LINDNKEYKTYTLIITYDKTINNMIVNQLLLNKVIEKFVPNESQETITFTTSYFKWCDIRINNNNLRFRYYKNNKYKNQNKIKIKIKIKIKKNKLH
jgi:hypothetical protein